MAEDNLHLDFFFDPIFAKADVTHQPADSPPLATLAGDAPRNAVDAALDPVACSTAAAAAMEMDFRMDRMEDLDDSIRKALNAPQPLDTSTSGTLFSVSDCSSDSNTPPASNSPNLPTIQTKTDPRTPKPLAVGDPGIAKKNKKLSPSRFCHICGKKPHCPFRVCTSIEAGTCQKIVCTNCIARFHLQNQPDGWRCCHCANTCPKRAQCHYYSKTNRARHLRLVQTKN